MTENEKRLRVWLANNGGASLAWLPATFDAALDEQRASARAEALDEAAGVADATAVHCGDTALAQNIAKNIRALVATPPPAFIPVERVREVLVRERNVALVAHHDLPVESVLDDIARDLGVPLDAAQKYRCLRCREPVSGSELHECVVTP